MKDATKQLKVNVNPEKLPILYVDTVFMNVNDDGVTFDMCQRIGNKEELQVVSRVGMSKDHAKKFVKKLGEILALSQSSKSSTSN